MLVTACPQPRGVPLSQPAPSGAMFDHVIDVLRRRYYDTSFVHDNLKPLSDEFRRAALAAATPAEEREVIWRLLTRIPASHLTLLSRRGYTDLLQDIAGQGRVMMGMQLVQVEGRYFAAMVLTGGPADVAGIREWDEIVRVDHVLPHQSSHVDPRSDDAYLSDDRDPPSHGVNASFGDTVRLQVVRVPGDTLIVPVAPKVYSMLEAARASVRLTIRNAVRVGYIHWWFMSSRGVPDGFDAALAGSLASSEALLLDLRGRGGSESAVKGVLRLLSPGPDQRFQGPIVALIDRRTRSAKEQLAYELRARGARLVGEATAGAYLPAGFETISNNLILMFPQRYRERSFAYYVTLIEQHPVTPDVAVQSAGPYSGGQDPLFEAGLDEAVRLVAERGAGHTLTGKVAK